MSSKRILIISTPVGPLGSGVGGGVELTLHSLVLGLTGRGHHVEVLAPEGSLHVGTVLHQIPGALQPSAHTADRDTPITVPANGVLAAMCDWVRGSPGRLRRDPQPRLRLVAVLPHAILRRTPLAHLVSMATAQRRDGRRHRTSGGAASAERGHAQPGAGEHASRPSPTGAHRRQRCHGRALRHAHHRRSTRGISGSSVASLPRRDSPTSSPWPRPRGLPLKVWGLMQDRSVWDAAIAAHPRAERVVRGVPADRRLCKRRSADVQRS